MVKQNRRCGEEKKHYEIYSLVTCQFTSVSIHPSRHCPSVLISKMGGTDVRLKSDLDRCFQTQNNYSQVKIADFQSSLKALTFPQFQNWNRTVLFPDSNLRNVKGGSPRPYYGIKYARKRHTAKNPSVVIRIEKC